MIEGVKVKRLVRHCDDRGFFQEILRDDDGLLKRFGQASMSKTYPGVIKAFHYHERQDDLWFFPVGNAQVVLHDLRENSPTRGETNVFYMGEDNPILLLIPAGVAHGYRTLQLRYPNGSKIELMEPLAGSTFFDSFFELTRGRGGVHHLNFHVPDIHAAVEALRERGYSLFGLNLDDPRWRDVFLHPKEAHGVLIQLAQPGPRDDERVPTLEDVLAGHGRRGNGIPSP